MTRRELVLGMMAAGIASAQAPVEELVNPGEFEAEAKKKLDAATYSLIAGGDRRGFDRITFRPRLMIDTRKFDLSAELFGQKLFTPIIVGPVSGLKRFHPEGEAEMAKGAAAGKALLVTPTARAGVSEGLGAVWLTPTVDRQFDFQEFKKPFVVKGVMTVDEARACEKQGAAAIVVSNYTGVANDPAYAASIDALPAIAKAVKIPVLMDGGIRRGSDVLKALALGARAVLIARAPVWGLSVYGAAGVQAVIELLQSELGRDMAMCGKTSVTSVDSSVVKIHAPGY